MRPINREIPSPRQEGGDCLEGRWDQKEGVSLLKRETWHVWIGWDIFNFFSETAKQNMQNLYKKLELNVLYQVCVFR